MFLEVGGGRAVAMRLAIRFSLEPTNTLEACPTISSVLINNNTILRTLPFLTTTQYRTIELLKRRSVLIGESLDVRTEKLINA